MPDLSRRPRLLLATAAACLLAAGCGSSGPPAPPAAAASSPAPAAALTVIDPWVKTADPDAPDSGAMAQPSGAQPSGAQPSGAQPSEAQPSGSAMAPGATAGGTGAMTAVFGTLTVTGSAPVTVVSAATSASPRTELHEVVTADGATRMRPKQGGFVVDPGRPLVLAPGGDHIMVMDMTRPIRAGDQVDVTLTLSDGTTTSFRALAKDTSGGEENYEGSDPAAAAGQGG